MNDRQGPGRQLEDTLIWTLLWLCAFKFTVGQQHDGSVELAQGIVVGLKVFPESSRTPVFSYLGIPYGQPPIGKLRFTPPLAHSGWTRKLYARNFQPICQQIEVNVYEETNNGYPYQSAMNENCLYLNVWTPETGLRYGNTPVLAIITGEEQAFDWARNRPTGLDLASEGLVVVTIQSRTNIFGWLTTETTGAPGNLGLLDQRLALQWIQTNIAKFGGDPAQVTLLGHGTSGATNALIHLTSPRLERRLFARLIIMSGTVFSTWSFQANRRAAQTSRSIIKNLTCDSTNENRTLECLQQKSVSDLLHAFENVYQNGNYTALLGPQLDNYLPDKSKRFIPEDPRILLSQHDYPDIPIIIGICNNEGGFMHELWLEMARESYRRLADHVNNTVIANILDHYGFVGTGVTQIKETINWRFFDQIPKTAPHLLSALQKLLSETRFEKPFYETIEMLSRSKNLGNTFDEIVMASALTANNQSNLIRQMDNGIMEHRGIQSEPFQEPTTITDPSGLYVYSFQHSNTMDLRGKVNYFGGAGHSADLLFLMGPSLYQQIGRRKLSQSEEKLCRRMRQYFSDFVKSGNPTPGRLFDAWQPYTQKRRYIQTIGSGGGDGGDNDVPDKSILELNKIQIAELISMDVNVTGSANDAYNNGVRKSDGGSRSPKSYLPEVSDSEYFLALGRVNAFWNELLPRIYRKQSVGNRIDGNRTDDDRDLEFLSNDVDSKFRHAFFSMLVLVCLLLAILGVCVYILRKNSSRIDTSYL